MKLISLIIIVLLSGFSCVGVATQHAEPNVSYRPVKVPVAIVDSDAQRQYVADHFWEGYNFADTALLVSGNLTDQLFGDFINIASRLKSSSNARRGIDAMMMGADTLPQTYEYFMNLAEQYLYDPNSPVRNEELYILVLRNIVANRSIDSLLKIRPRMQLQMALKNRPGTPATDFEITLSSGESIRLSDTKGEYILLYFNNPDCHDCKRIREYIISSTLCSGMIRSGELKVVAVYIDEDLSIWRRAAYPSTWINGYDRGRRLSQEEIYDLKAIPTLYLLDSKRNVLLKDATIEQIEAYLGERP